METNGVVERVKKYKSRWKGKYTKVLLLSQKGLTAAEISKKTCISLPHVNRIMQKDEFRSRQGEMELSAIGRARDLFEAKAYAAAKKIVKLAKSGKPEERLQFEAAKEVLYQVGLKPVDVVETRQREYTLEEIQTALEVSKEVERISEELGGQTSPFLLRGEIPPTSAAVQISSADESSESVDVAKTEEATEPDAEA